MTEFTQSLIIVCLFLAYIITVIVKPNKFKFSSKTKNTNNGDVLKEVNILLENDNKKES